MTTRSCPPLAGRDLRYVLTMVLQRSDGPLTVGDLIACLHHDGLTVAGRSSKTISDALRWEVGRGRVVKVDRSTYRRGTIPRSTAWWIRQYLRDRSLV